MLGGRWECGGESLGRGGISGFNGERVSRDLRATWEGLSYLMENIVNPDMVLIRLISRADQWFSSWTSARHTWRVLYSHKFPGAAAAGLRSHIMRHCMQVPAGPVLLRPLPTYSFHSIPRGIRFSKSCFYRGGKIINHKKLL